MLNEETKAILIIGIGNSGRKDDGLGWMILDSLKNKFSNVDLLYRYQLQIEDAEEVSHYPTVIFVDATKEVTNNGFYFEPCIPNEGIGLLSHMLKPETVIWLENSLYKKEPVSYVMGIEGKEWGLSAKPSEKGLLNLNKARTFLEKNISLILEKELPNILQSSKHDVNHTLRS